MALLPVPETGRVNERTFYPALLDIIKEKGGSGVQEVAYKSVPDIHFKFGGNPWLLSVKIGETVSVIKSGMLQYLRHKEDSRIPRGLFLIFPESFRKVPPNPTAIRNAVQKTPVTCLIDAGPIKTEYRDVPFEVVLDRLERELQALFATGEERHYSLRFIIDLLRAHVVDMMRSLNVAEDHMLRLVTHWKLLSELAHLEKGQINDVAQFLAAYVFLSQVLFLRMFSVVHPDIVDVNLAVSRRKIRNAFERILEINYRPIFNLEVLDAIPDRFLEDTFSLIWAMQVERVRYELPGRLFHELMPPGIRKLLAAFYTRPQAAEILARLTIRSYDEKIIDPACGSGTILTSAYRQKKRLFEGTGLVSNPHQRFCESEIFGADIMPFAVHLACANLAAMDITQTIRRSLITQGDSLELVSGKTYPGGIQQLGLFAPGSRHVLDEADDHNVQLPERGVDVVLMNPPFTKIERGIAEYLHMEKFRSVIGGEVGLWGHFILLADSLLKKGGSCGAVIPISVLRGRESDKVRDFVFSNWRPLYLVKSTRSYAFSENAEYRDILLVAVKEPPQRDDVVKVCFLKKNLASMADGDIEDIAEQLASRHRRRSPVMDIDSYRISELRDRGRNMLWFLGTEDLSHRDVLVRFCKKCEGSLGRFPEEYFREGFRPVPKGISKLLFLTRAFNKGRVEESFLQFDREGAKNIHATTKLGIEWKFDLADFTPSLRTSVGIAQMDISELHDYIACQPYDSLSKIKQAAGFTGAIPRTFWERVQQELEAVKTRIVVARRLDYGSPNFFLTAWVSDVPISPSNQVSVVRESNLQKAEAVCVVLNSALFLAHFFLLKEQSHARYADIRFYDLHEMPLFPENQHVGELSKIFKRFRNTKFPALRQQLDQNFDQRYEEYWEEQNASAKQAFLFRVLDKPIEPHSARVQFDMAVCRALGIDISEAELRELYEVIVKEITITRRLSKD